jgi:hypothetical protein
VDTNITRRLALSELLEKPDPPGMHRGHVMRLEGKPDRHEQLPLLAVAFVRAKLAEIRQRALQPAGPSSTY